MAIRTPLTAAEKQFLQTRRTEQATLATIAAELHCARETVRQHWRRIRRQVVVRPRGRPRRGVLSTFPPALVERALALKRAHPHWGPANVRLELVGEAWSTPSRLPSVARLAILFRQACPEAVQPRRHTIYPARAPTHASVPHQRWQMDGKEAVAVGVSEQATILSVRDPVSAVMIANQAFETQRDAHARKLTRQEVQDTLRTGFEQFGQPLEVQTDHEGVYIGAPQGDFPSPFTLWLYGCGIVHVTSRDRRPTDQAHVERGHRTVGDMAWHDEQPASVPHLQAQLDVTTARYNTQLPVVAAHCHGQPPLLARPDAAHSGRPYRRDCEWLLFDLDRVDAYLSTRVWTRQVNASGNLSLGNYFYTVGRQYAHQRLSIRFTPGARTFGFQSADGQLLAELPAEGLNKAYLIGWEPPRHAPLDGWQLPLPLVGV